MAQYTIELRHVVENHNIFNFKYPFYDESKRLEFEKSFIRHFYFREIGAETIDRFMHYLEDKMLTVFPYYNELFNAANIEYSILNNYNLTEEFETTRINKGKSSGISSTVGQAFGTQETENQADRVVDSEGNVTGEGTDTEKETTNQVAESSESSETSGTSKTTVEGSDSKTFEGSETDTRNVTKKFLDTPQGLTDLTNSKYLTTINQDSENGSKQTNNTEGGTNSQESNTTNSENGSRDGNSETDTTRNLTRNSTNEQNTTGKETTKDTASGVVRDEQKTTQDNNSRTYMDSRQTEKHKLTRIGNIGVDTDSDMIEKHIHLQKTLKQIELLFFGECEDLFMLVY